MAEILHDHFSVHAANNMSAYDMKKLMIAQCREDHLEELETRTVKSAIHVPNGKRLIAMLYSDERRDFDFQYYDAQSNLWKNKTPLAEHSEREDLPKFLPGGYVLTRLFVAPENIEPKGVPKGRTHVYEEQGIILNLPDAVQPWERGACFKKAQGGFLSSRTDKIYASPELSFSKF